MSTRNGTDRPRSAGPITRFTSRAWNRIAIRPGASLSTAACSASVQTPEGAHWFKLSRDGSGWIVVRLVEALAVWRREAVRAPIAQVCLGRSHIAPIRLHLGALGVDGHERRIEAFLARFAEQLLNSHLRHGVLALAEVVVAD